MRDITIKTEDYREALSLLKEGNKRYVENRMNDVKDYDKVRKKLKEGQWPFAAILTCSDSRVAPEIYFDQTLGNLFTIRNAGNIADETVLGSIEYAVDSLNVPLVVVCGHSNCGAMTAAHCGGEFSKNLETIIDKIKSIDEGSKNPEELAIKNIKETVKEIQLNPIVKEKGTEVIGAYYDIDTGFVKWV